MLVWLFLYSLLPSISALRIPLHRSSLPKRSLASTRFPVSNHLNVVPTQSQYYAYLTIGTPPQVLRVLLDTTSPYIYLPSAACVSCLNSHKFHPTQSSTFHNLSTPVHLIVPGGAVNGTLGSDVIGLGSFKETDVKLVLGETGKYTSDRLVYDGVVVMGR